MVDQSALNNDSNLRTYDLGSANLPSEAQLLVYEAFRRRIVDEDNLIHNRTTWQLGVHTILLAVWAGVLAAANLVGHPLFVWPFVLALSVIGWASGAVGFITVQAAHKEIAKAKAAYKRQYSALYYDYGIPKLTGTDKTHDSGHLIPRGIPVAFIVLHAATLLIALVVAFNARGIS